MLKESAEVIVALNLTPEQLNEQIKGADALIVRSATKVRAICRRLNFKLQMRASGDLSLLARAGRLLGSMLARGAGDHDCAVPLNPPGDPRRV